jgi:metal-responsive CopG/Arc/MetJ family transcriptional regulator
MEAVDVDKLDEAWRSRGIKNRMEFFRGALGSYLKQLGAEHAAAPFVSAAALAV